MKRGVPTVLPRWLRLPIKQTSAPTAIPILTRSPYLEALAICDENRNGLTFCAEARAHGKESTHGQQPEYESIRDSDGDGLAYEWPTVREEAISLRK